LLERHERGELSQGEAAEMLGVSERTFRRWRDRLRDKGPEGLRDRRIGKPSSRRAAAEEQLGIRDIAAYSPRAAQPLRARLPHLAGSATQGAGLAGSQRRLRGGPGQASSAFVADRSGRVCDLLCVQEERRVGNDNTIKWRGLSLQIPPSPLRPHFVRATVRMHDYPDGRLTIFHGPHRLADYGHAGNPCGGTKLAA
jgi:hypothetical protein